LEASQERPLASFLLIKGDVVDIETLKLFCDVIKLKGFTQAAAANSITQSAVSQRLKSLEKRFGTLLIERRGSELYLTKAGEELYQGAQRVLAEFREIEEHVQGIEGKAGGAVRVAAIYSVGLYELDHSVKQFLTTYPQIEVQIEYSRASKIYQDILNGSVDLGIVAYPPNKPQLRSIPFREDELVLICPTDHPFSRDRSISLKKLASQPFVSFQRDIPTRKALDDILKRHGISVTVKAEFDNIELIKRAVEIGLGLSVVPSMTVKSEVQTGLLKAIPLAEGPFMRPIAIVYRRGRSLPPAVKKFIAVLTGATNSSSDPSSLQDLGKRTDFDSRSEKTERYDCRK
jgi:DNA-binding transcriptional LysR family regulator